MLNLRSFAKEAIFQVIRSMVIGYLVKIYLVNGLIEENVILKLRQYTVTLL